MTIIIIIIGKCSQSWIEFGHQELWEIDGTKIYESVEVDAKMLSFTYLLWWWRIWCFKMMEFKSQPCIHMKKVTINSCMSAWIQWNWIISIGHYHSVLYSHKLNLSLEFDRIHELEFQWSCFSMNSHKLNLSLNELRMNQVLFCHQ